MKRNNFIKVGISFLFILISLIFSNVILEAEESTMPTLDAEVKTVAIFKNGFGFFIREGELSLKEGWAMTKYVPRSALGSMWLASLNEGSVIEEAIAFKENVEHETEAITMEDMLRVNLGQKVKITVRTASSEDEILEGIIRAVPQARKIEQDTPIEYNNPSSYYYGYPYVSPTPGTVANLSNIVVIETKDGKVVLGKSYISKIEFPEDMSNTILVREAKRRIKFKIKSQKKKAELRLSYLQKGISWVPSYLVNIENPEKARLTMKATVINDVEDLENVEVFFVVGYPNFIYADILSPMTLDQSISQFIGSLTTSRRQSSVSPLSNVMTQSVSAYEARAGARSNLDYGYSAIEDLAGESEEDLFLYDKKGLNLKKGERAYYHLFSKEVDYKHIYEWEVPDIMKVDSRGYSQSNQNLIEKEQVWHSIRLTNSSGYPWTTAPAFVISGWKPLAQDMINYTPKGANINLKLTVATDIKADSREYEINRERDVTLYGSRYDLVTVKGELYLKNFKAEDVTIEIKKKLRGEVIEVSHNGKVEKVVERLQDLNYNSSILWEIVLKASEEINVIYEYKVYVHR